MKYVERAACLVAGSAVALYLGAAAISEFSKSSPVNAQAELAQVLPPTMNSIGAAAIALDQMSTRSCKLIDFGSTEEITCFKNANNSQADITAIIL